MSLYKKCSAAAGKLMKGPPEHLHGVFTEIDVVNEAASQEWSTANYKEALRHANQVLGTAYRARKIHRFGPIDVDGTRDYGRVASKIAYAPIDGIQVWETTNGSFPALRIEDDNFSAAGRKTGSNRNDLAPWDAQDISVTRIEVAEPGGPPVDEKPLLKRIQELEKEVRNRDQRIEGLENEVKRGVPTVRPDADAFDLIEDLSKRLEWLEEREHNRERLYK